MKFALAQGLAAVLLTSLVAQTHGADQPVESAGAGRPCVVFESGLGDGLRTWDGVRRRLAENTAVFAYSRAGYDGTPAPTAPRDGATIVAELRALLHARGVPPPYVLVGHSIGGLYVQLFARSHPDEVAGVVLVDPSHPEQFNRMRAAAPEAHARAVARWQGLPAPFSDEGLAFEKTGRQVLAAGAWPDVPTILLSARDASKEIPPQRAAFLQLHAELATRLPGAKHWFAEGSGHYIHRDAPELVARAIDEVRAAIKTRSRSAPRK